MKLSCEIIKDMLPLYCDSICSEETKAAVEEHLTDCTSCSEELKKMKSNLPITVLKNEEGGIIIGGYKMNLLRKFLILILCAFVLPLINSLISRIYTDDISDFTFFITAAALIPNVYIQKIKAKDSPIRVLVYSMLFAALMIIGVLRFLGFDVFLSGHYSSNYEPLSWGNLLVFFPIIVYSAISVALYVLRFKKDPLPASQYKKTVTTFLIYETEIILYIGFVYTFKYMGDIGPNFSHLTLIAFVLAFFWFGYLFFTHFKRKVVFNIGVCITALGIFLPTYAAIEEMIRHESFHAANAFWNANLLDPNKPTANSFLLMLIILCTTGIALILIGLVTEKMSAQSDRSEQPNLPEKSEHKEEEEEKNEEEQEEEEEE